MNEALYEASEEEMWRQAAWATTIPSVESVVITPDAHAGAGVPIGLVVATKDYVAPCAAGYDISCGMLSMRTSLIAENIKDKIIRRSWMQEVESRVACGLGGHRVDGQIRINGNLFEEILQNGILALDAPQNIRGRFERTHHIVKRYVRFKKAADRGMPELASLGSGNHFLELQQDQKGTVWIMIHTGSRGYGHQVATEFFNRGFEWWNQSHPNEILGKGQKELVSFPVDSEIGQDYLNAMNQAANYAIVNRYLIAKAVIEATEKVFKSTPEILYEISHNLVQYEGGLWVHRKGATRALPAGHELLKGSIFETTGHPVLIPGSMGTSSAILTPKDSEKSLHSVNHGCGRVMSRGRAKRTFAQDVLNKEMDDMDILYNSRNVPIDESLHCYKDIDEVLSTVEGAELAITDIRLYPRAVIKGES